MAKMSVSGNTYRITRKRPFVDTPVASQQVEDALPFAYDMVYGEEGHHRAKRSGGWLVRDNLEMFANTFQGKLAEIALHDRLAAEGIAVSDLDFGIYGYGKWDNGDLLANGKRLNVKSAAHFAHLLLLEQKDWDENGLYIPDRGKGKSAYYDCFVLVRIKPDAKTLLKDHEKFSEATKTTKMDTPPTQEDFKEIIGPLQWFYDIAGCISHDTLVKGIRERQRMPQGALLNGKMPMDANNYYFQAGAMVSGYKLIEKLKELCV